MTCSLEGSKSCKIHKEKKEIRITNVGYPDIKELTRLVKKTFGQIFANFTITPATGFPSPKGQPTDWVVIVP
ncbi:hypothetical protein ACFL2U_02625 [Patescibacteria group bacterium]